jgi:quercetin dioxygenase-like cupin family protein
MMHPPTLLTPDSFSSFDVHTIAAELLEAARAADDGKAARTLVKSPELTVVATALRAGASLLEHAAPGPVVVLPLHGRVSFTAPEQSANADVADGHLLGMGPGLRHAVTASEDAVFLLLIGGPPGPPEAVPAGPQ